MAGMSSDISAGRSGWRVFGQTIGSGNRDREPSGESLRVTGRGAKIPSGMAAKGRDD